MDAHRQAGVARSHKAGPTQPSARPCQHSCDGPRLDQLLHVTTHFRKTVLMAKLTHRPYSCAVSEAPAMPFTRHACHCGLRSVQQGILVDFSGFASKLIGLLDRCVSAAAQHRPPRCRFCEQWGKSLCLF